MISVMGYGFQGQGHTSTQRKLTPVIPQPKRRNKIGLLKAPLSQRGEGLGERVVPHAVATPLKVANPPYRTSKETTESAAKMPPISAATSNPCRLKTANTASTASGAQATSKPPLV